MGRRNEYCRDVNVSWEIQHETEQNLISTSTFCPTIYIPRLKRRIHKDHFSKSRPAGESNKKDFGKGRDVWSRQIIFQFEGINYQTT